MDTNALLNLWKSCADYYSGIVRAEGSVKGSVPLYVLIATALVVIFLAMTQDFHIFPGLYSSIIMDRKNKVPEDVDAIQTLASDGETVNIWRMRAEDVSQKRIAILFHGNAEYLSTFVSLQRWLRSLGITTYAVEYRGFSGRNSGWPSEAGFYSDGEAAFKLIEAEEGVDPHDVVIFGVSIGTGIAAYLAQKFNTSTLVLISPYTSLPDLVSEIPLLGYIVPLLKYNFPTGDYIGRLTNTCVIVAHGMRDNTIPFQHSLRLRELYRGNGNFNLIASEEAGHNDLLAHIHGKIAEAINLCLKPNTDQELSITEE